MVNFLVVDDEPLILRDMERMLREVSPAGSNIITCNSPLKALEVVRETSIQVAFLDISMPQMTGIEFATRLQEVSPNINIIFTTAYDEHMVTAWNMYASGYLLKPVMASDLKAALSHLRYPIDMELPKLEVRCFGNFECFYNGQPVIFSRTQSKEFFAYLVDRRGVMVEQNELRAALWEAEKDTDQKKSYIRTIASDIRSTFAKLGLENVLLHQRGRYGVDATYMDCDYYNYLDGDKDALRSYNHEYMKQYSWGETTYGALEDSFWASFNQ